MAPSRGKAVQASVGTSSQDEAAINQQSQSALINARRNFRYLINPTSSDAPGRLRTRALLRAVRYITQFVIWRAIRWAKYAAVGALVAAVGATAFGTAISGVGWILAPPSIGASIVAMGVWSAGKFAARRLHKKWQATGMDEGEERREIQSDNPAAAPGRLGPEVGPQAVPW